MLKKNIYVFHVIHFVGGDVPERVLTEVASRYPYQAIVFNNGLHSLHWTPEKVSDDLVRERMGKMANCFIQGAPQAKIFYLNTTPHTAARPEPRKPVAALGELNGVVLRLNQLSAQVMQAKGIAEIDAYNPLTQKLELAIGDGYHWTDKAYQIIAQEVAQKVLPSLGK
jgi:lysophospholipase L1-like esterase